MATVKDILREKRAKEAHHLWNAERADGKIKITRTQAEKDDWDNMEKQAGKKAGLDTVRAGWGLFGASLVDDASLTNEIPGRIAQRFNEVVPENVPKIASWEELRDRFGEEPVSEIRKAVANGIKVRLASKYLDVPFLYAADIVAMTEGVDAKHVKAMVEMIKAGNTKNAVKTYGEEAVKIAEVFDYYKKAGFPKLSIDSNAKKLLEDYWGPFGKELTREISKRVRADLAERWMRRNAIDSSAAEYWSKYFGEYGQKWVSVVPKLLKPAK